MSPSSTRFKSPIKDRSIDWGLTDGRTDGHLTTRCLCPLNEPVWVRIWLHYTEREVNRSAAAAAVFSPCHQFYCHDQGEEIDKLFCSTTLQRTNSSLSVGPVILIDDFSTIRREIQWFIPLETPSSLRNGQFTFIWFPSPQRSSNWCYYSTTSTPRMGTLIDGPSDQWHRTCYQIPFGR